MERDARKMRKGAPFVFTNLMSLEGLDIVIHWIQKYALVEELEEPKFLRYQRAAYTGCIAKW